MKQLYVAYTYGSSSYDRCTYATNNCTGTNPGGGTQNTNGSLLTNTGFDIALVITIACVLSLAAVLVRFWRRPAKPTKSTD